MFLFFWKFELFPTFWKNLNFDLFSKLILMNIPENFFSILYLWCLQSKNTKSAVSVSGNSAKKINLLRVLKGTLPLGTPPEEFPTRDNRQTSLTEASGTHTQNLCWLALIYIWCMLTPLSSPTMTSCTTLTKCMHFWRIRIYSYIYHWCPADVQLLSLSVCPNWLPLRVYSILKCPSKTTVVLFQRNAVKIYVCATF